MDEKIDILSRSEFVKQTREIIDLLADGRSNATFAINGTWGCGKTFVLNLLEKDIGSSNGERKYVIVHYDCWKYDYYQEPLVAMVSAILHSIEKQLLTESEVKHITTKLKIAGTFLAKQILKVTKEIAGVDLTETYNDVKEAFGSNELAEAKASEYDDFHNFNTILSDLRESLGELAKNRVVIFTVDELDRCLPTYALTVLERLHHLTDGIENVITIVATDKKQLEKTIGKVYGADHGSKYLQKFFQFEITLNNGEISNDINKKYDLLLSKYKPWKNNCLSLPDFLNIAFKNMTIRDQEHIMKKVELVHSLIWKSEESIFPTLYTEVILAVLVMKYGFPNGVPNPAIKDCKKPIASLCPKSKETFSEFDELLYERLCYMTYCTSSSTEEARFILAESSDTLQWSIAQLDGIFSLQEGGSSTNHFTIRIMQEAKWVFTNEIEKIKAFYTLLIALKETEEI